MQFFFTIFFGSTNEFYFFFQNNLNIFVMKSYLKLLAFKISAFIKLCCLWKLIVSITVQMEMKEFLALKPSRTSHSIRMCRWVSMCVCVCVNVWSPPRNTVTECICRHEFRPCAIAWTVAVYTIDCSIQYINKWTNTKHFSIWSIHYVLMMFLY